MTLVRPADAADAGAVWPLVADFATSYVPEREVFATSFNDLIARDDTVVLVAEQGGAIGGYLLASIHGTFFANAPVAWVEEVMVEPASRRNGIGAKLMAEAESWARSQGAAYISLATRRAAAFYDALGYEDSAAFFRKLL